MIETQEVWRLFDIGLYAVSNMGRVKRVAPGINTYPEKILSLGKSSNGYLIAAVSTTGNKRINFLVHRLVATAFIGDIVNKLEVNHKDGNKHNNCVDNLEIITRSENLKHAIRIGLSKAPTKRSCGDDHWTRKHPDKVARGELNGARLHPDKILKGSKCPSSKLTEKDVLEIRRLRADGRRFKDIACQFQTSIANVHDIVSRKSWRHI